MSARTIRLFACVMLTQSICAVHAEINSAQSAIDLHIINGTVYTGDALTPSAPGTSVEIIGTRIHYIGPQRTVESQRTIDARGLIISPGFIDPHTHADNDLLDSSRSLNEAYLRQGVSTVFIGNDGDGLSIDEIRNQLKQNTLGTHVALLRGHGALRREVIGDVNRSATPKEISRMSGLLMKDMQDGAFGLSSGLFYAPGSYASTDELIALARVSAAAGGIYDSHIRDEADYNIGLLASIDEAILISDEAKIPAHIAHIKALGPAVHGFSQQVIERINKAHSRGLNITADQYPWLASGTRISNALFPRRLMDGGKSALHKHLRDHQLLEDVRPEFNANLNRRGGPAALLITGESQYRGHTLAELSQRYEQDHLKMATRIVLVGDPAIASFMMREDDLDAFAAQPWVVTGSDGSSGHPRKYGSFPKKYQQMVETKSLLSTAEFIVQSSAKTAQIFKLCDRGILRTGFYADLAIWDPAKYQATANYQYPERLAQGVVYMIVNGHLAIDNGVLTDKGSGRVLSLRECTTKKTIN